MAHQSVFPATREQAWTRWREFSPQLIHYAARRNQVASRHDHVSRLSAAVRYRLLTEQELIASSLAQWEFESIEKWLQELCWRRYWKGWLERHPQVWWDFVAEVEMLDQQQTDERWPRAMALMEGRSGVAIMDHWALELRETGYLHNHARMWWASFWVHAEGLPWQWGAAFFYRHLLDADPASNTLSWRWVSGLHTLGKSYLVRWSNIQRFAPELAQRHEGGHQRLLDGGICAQSQPAAPPISSEPLLRFEDTSGDHRAEHAVWVVGDDLLPELGPLASMRPRHLLLSPPWHAIPQSPLAQQWQQQALADCRARCEQHFSSAEVEVGSGNDPCEDVWRWAQRHQIRDVVCLVPCVGALPVSLQQWIQRCQGQGVTLHCLRRSEDRWAYDHCDKGFFSYWEKQRRQLLTQFPPRQQQWIF